MSTCKDCLHYEACKGTYYTAKGNEDILYEFEGEMYAHSGCEHFKPKADYVEVVRCKDCKYLIPEKMICTHIGNRTFNTGFTTFGNHFCSYGERKEK